MPEKIWLKLIESVPYDVAIINTEVFLIILDMRMQKRFLYAKYCYAHPDKILQSIRPYVNEPFADSLIVLASIRNPVQLYSYAQSNNSPEGILIHRNTNSMVMAVAKLSQTPNALLYFPFLDDLLSGKQTQTV